MPRDRNPRSRSLDVGEKVAGRFGHTESSRIHVSDLDVSANTLFAFPGRTGNASRRRCHYRMRVQLRWYVGLDGAKKPQESTVAMTSPYSPINSFAELSKTMQSNFGYNANKLMIL